MIIKIYGAVKWDGGELIHGEQTYNYPFGTGGFTVCVWDRDGESVSSINIPSTCSSSLYLKNYDTRLNNRGEIFLAGTFDQSLAFGEHQINAGGTQKMFMAKYGYSCSINSELSGEFCYGDVYHGLILTSSGDYQVIIPSSTEGIDSIITLHATVNQEIISGINDTAVCINQELLIEANPGYQSYLWGDGSQASIGELAFSEEGVYSVYLTITDNNCSHVDSIKVSVTACNYADYNQIGEVIIYPVPAQYNIYIELPDNKDNNNLLYRILDIYGRELKSGTLSDSAEIDVNDLMDGQYIIEIVSKDSVYLGRFMKSL